MAKEHIRSFFVRCRGSVCQALNSYYYQQVSQLKDYIDQSRWDTVWWNTRAPPEIMAHKNKSCGYGNLSHLIALRRRVLCMLAPLRSLIVGDSVIFICTSNGRVTVIIWGRFFSYTLFGGPWCAIHYMPAPSVLFIICWRPLCLAGPSSPPTEQQPPLWMTCPLAQFRMAWNLP